MGFSQAISGLSAASNNLDVIGNNIANSETTGFKAATVTFADVYAASAVGLGVTVAAVTQDFSDGTVTSTNVGTDVAISGNGFFRLMDSSGNVYYTRDGAFTTDSSGNLIHTASGYYLTGYSATDGTVNVGAEPINLSIDTSGMAATATTSATIVANLNSSADAITATFDASDSSTYSYTDTVTTYDSLGNTHNIAFYYVKSDSNTWDVYAVDTSVDNADVQSLGTLTFTSSGTLESSTVGSVALTSLNGSEATSFSVSYTGTTQQNSDSTVSSKTQDGYSVGTLNSYTINDDGTITGTYSNGKTQTLGQIVLASFANTSGLSSEGTNLWSATAAAGQEILGIAGSGTFGALTSGALESSNVDLSAELVNLIVAQRNYQSNAQTIKAQDAILNTLVNLR
ncbi:flagellar hook protein FlgE [Brenneria tiliae]|uniref:flagellar hook protein FlgE n=1 Tax=Brenneria tiliae TaxID=2914984 RepID=UPI0020149E01|nr:flagellar hook protein FlgE [Brenneria tiliae]MCL2899819.1 flagellar hook protein FlgE [Brenneria tiliae]MCL2904692.1 flagellar hook protein FlgE [Brenneria tiliae]